MALTKVVYVNGVTVITAENLNEIQDAIIALEEASSMTVDTALSTTSTNPVQNQAIANAIQALQTALAGKANSSAIPQNVLQYVSQTLTTAQQTQARDNIGAASVEDLGTVFSGYIEKPASPAIDDFLCWNGTTWAATTVPSASGVSF